MNNTQIDNVKDSDEPVLNNDGDVINIPAADNNSDSFKF